MWNAAGELQASRFGNLQVDTDNIVCQVFELVDATRQGSDFYVSRGIDLADLDGQVTVRVGLAKQCLVLSGVLVVKCRRQAILVVNRTAEDIALAVTAVTIATAIGQYNALSQGGIKYRLGWLDIKGVAAGRDGDLVGHDDSWKCKRASIVADSGCKINHIKLC